MPVFMAPKMTKNQSCYAERMRSGVLRHSFVGLPSLPACRAVLPIFAPAAACAAEDILALPNLMMAILEK